MFEAEVQAGITVLNEKEIDWRPAALHEGLDMANMQLCVLGRSIETDPHSWDNGYIKARRDWGVNDEWMEIHGFYIDDETSCRLDASLSTLYAELAETWRRAARGELVPA